MSLAYRVLVCSSHPLQATGKGDTPAGAELLAEIEKFQKKVQSGLEEYSYVNQKTKADVVEAKRQHDHLMDQLIITTIVCQAELFHQAAAQLEAIIDTIPEDRVREVREKIHEYVKQGGVRPAAPAEKSKLMLGLDVFTGKALPSDLNKPKESAAPVATAAAAPAARPTSAAPSAPPAPPAAFTAAKANPFAAGDPFEENDDSEGGNPFAAAPPSAPPAAPVVARGANMVEALFDHDAEEEDELSFATGDWVEVIERPDGGWWRGRCHGKEGLFPSNYVKN
jgi:amphiphysin